MTYTAEDLYETFAEEMERQKVYPEVWPGLPKVEKRAWKGLATRIEKGKVCRYADKINKMAKGKK